MFDKLKYLSNLVLNAGIRPELTFQESLRIRLANQLVCLGFSLLFLYALYQLFWAWNIVECIFMLIWAMIFTLPLILNYLGKFNITYFVIIYIPLVMVSVVYLLYGEAHRLDTSFVFLMACCFYFFDLKVAIKNVAVVFFVYLLVLFLLYFLQAPFEGKVNFIDPLFYLFFAMIAFVWLSYKTVLDTSKYYSTIKQQSQKLSRQNEELDRFSYIAAHDLKTPLRNITSYIGLIDLKLNSPDERIQTYIQQAKANADSLQRLIDEILEYSKLDNTAHNHQPSNLNLIVEEIKLSLAGMCADRNASILIENQLPTIYGDSLQLRILFQNIIENGIKYNDSKNPTIKISSRIVSNVLQCRVLDNGIGIKKKYLEKIFTLFTRLHAESKYKGTGLGLAISKKIIEKHMGSIHVESEQGLGSTFTLNFPIDLILRS